MEKKANFSLMKIKKLIVVALLLFSMILLGGCATVDYSVISLSTGVVSQSVVVSIDENALASSTHTAEDVVNETSAAYTKYIYDKMVAFKNANGYRLITDGGAYYIKSILGSTLIESAYESSITEGKIEMYISFSNREIYYAYYDIDPNDSSDNNVEIEEGIFYDKHIQKTHSAFYDLENNVIANEFSAVFTEFGITSPTYRYAYVTDSESLKSNAQNIYYSNYYNAYVHEFLIEDSTVLANSVEEKYEIEFYTIAINSMSWYILALVLTALFIIILVIIKKINGRKKEKENGTMQI